MTPAQAETAIKEALREVTPDADTDSLAADADLRDTLELDSIDFLRFVEILGRRGQLVRLWSASTRPAARRPLVLDYRARRGEEQALVLVLPPHQVRRFAVVTVDFGDPAVPVRLALPGRLHCEDVAHCSLHAVLLSLAAMV
jgi:hypothetical protein